METIKVYFADATFKTLNIDTKKTSIEEIWELIGDRLGFTVDVAQNFFIWGFEDDLELLLYSHHSYEMVKQQWLNYQKKWSNMKKKKSHAGVRLMFRPTSILPISVERNLRDPEAINLFYAQAVHNVTNSDYPCTLETAIELAGLQAQVVLGNYNPILHKPGHLKKAVYWYFPQHLNSQKRMEEWETLLYAEQAKHTGKEKMIAQMLYLQLVRQWPYYGSTFFRVLFKPATNVYYNVQFNGQIVVGINWKGLHMIDPVIMKIVTVPFEEVLRCDADKKHFVLYQKLPNDAKGRPNERAYLFKTKQAELINDLIYDWFAELKRQKITLDKTRQLQTMESPKQHTLDMPESSNDENNNNNVEMSQLKKKTVSYQDGEAGSTFYPQAAPRSNTVSEPQYSTPPGSPAHHTGHTPLLLHQSPSSPPPSYTPVGSTIHSHPSDRKSSLANFPQPEGLSVHSITLSEQSEDEALPSYDAVVQRPASTVEDSSSSEGEQDSRDEDEVLPSYNSHLDGGMATQH